VRIGRVVTGVGFAGTATLAYAVGYERTAYTLRRLEIPVLAPRASGPIRLLQISDLHVLPSQRGKLAWVSDLARLVPDVVALTGDVLSAQASDAPTLRALEPLFAFPGLFVPGNNDYALPTFKSPHRYLRSGGHHPHGAALDWKGFASDLAKQSGWLDLTNTRATMNVAGMTVDVRGVDDARLRRDKLARVAGPADPDAALALGLSHTPEPRVLDAFTADGVALTLSGHTHGGQVRLPGFGALVSNCGLSRTRARGLSRHYAGSRTSYLHVSAGLGTSPYAPLRFACRPEATLMTLVPVST
jgi:predicted MPP superfamily phosphohydrolase